jgi:hypothetical protein
MNGSLTLGDAVVNRRSPKNPGMSRSFSREHLSAEVVRTESGEYGHFRNPLQGRAICIVYSVIAYFNHPHLTSRLVWLVLFTVV